MSRLVVRDTTRVRMGHGAEVRAGAADGGRGLLALQLPIAFVVTRIDVRAQFRLGVVALGNALGVSLRRRRSGRVVLDPSFPRRLGRVDPDFIATYRDAGAVLAVLDLDLDVWRLLIDGDVGDDP